MRAPQAGEVLPPPVVEKVEQVRLLVFLLLFSIAGIDPAWSAEPSSSVAAALASFKQGQTQEAITHLKKWIDKNPRDLEARHALAEIYLASEDFRNARETYLDLIDKNPEDAQAYHNLGLLYLKEERPEEAVQNLVAAVAINPDLTEGYFNLGELALLSNRLDRAFEFFQKADVLSKKAEPSRHSRAHEKLGMVHAKKGEPEKAAEQFKIALKIDPKNVQAEQNLGFVYLAMGNVGEAEGKFQNVLRLQPENSSAHYGLGIALRQLKQNEQALREFQKAIEANPELIDAYLHLAALFAAQGKNSEALQVYRKTLPLYQKFLESNPDHSAVRLQYAKVLIQTEGAEEAKKQLKKILKKEKKENPLAQESKSLLERIKR